MSYCTWQDSLIFKFKFLGTSKMYITNDQTFCLYASLYSLLLTLQRNTSLFWHWPNFLAASKVQLLASLTFDSAICLLKPTFAAKSNISNASPLCKSHSQHIILRVFRHVKEKGLKIITCHLLSLAVLVLSWQYVAHLGNVY